MTRRRLSILPLVAGLFVASATMAQTRHVFDYFDSITPNKEATLERDLRAHAQKTKQMVSVIIIRTEVPSGDYTEEEQRRDALGKTLGGATKPDGTPNDGVVLMVAVADRRILLSIGDGMPPPYMTQANGIVKDVILPQVRKGDLEAGVLQGIAAVLQQLRLDVVPN